MERGRRVLRGLPIWSERHGLVGKADVVELLPADPPYREAIPVEYKVGRRTDKPHALLQACAQALCLEEMFGLEVRQADVFFVESRERVSHTLTADLRERTLAIVEAVHDGGASTSAAVGRSAVPQVLAHRCLSAVCRGQGERPVRIPIVRSLAASKRHLAYGRGGGKGWVSESDAAGPAGCRLAPPGLRPPSPLRGEGFSRSAGCRNLFWAFRTPLHAVGRSLSVKRSGRGDLKYERVGLDPQCGFLHVLRPGRPALALDLVEEFRSIILDRFCLTLVNRKQIRPSDFDERPGGSVMLNADGRKKVLAELQRRKAVEVQHPLLAQKVPIGLLPHLQARLLARTLRGDLTHYPPYVPS